MADSAFAPWSTTLLIGPMQPVQGMFPPGQAAAQPARVAGPRQTMPWASRHRSGSMSVWCGRRYACTSSLSGFVAARGHSEQSATSGASTAPFSGSVPVTSAVAADRISSTGGGQPGR